MVPSHRIHGMCPGPGWARLMLMLLTLAAICGISGAGVFDPPFASSALDAANYSVYVDGSTAAMSGVPTDVLWTTDSTTSGAPVVFGNTKTAGARHLRIGFTSAQTIGTVIVKGNVTVSVLKGTASYPGTLSNEADWTLADRLDGKTVAQTQPKSWQAHDVSVWVLPAGTSTRAIRLTHSAKQSDYAYEGSVSGVCALAGRYGNLAPQGQATGPNPKSASLLNNNADEGHWGVAQKGWTQQAWDNGTNAAVLSESNVETVYFILPTATTLRGLVGVSAGFAGARVEYLPTTVTAHPRETKDSDWAPISANWAIPPYGDDQLGLARFDFGANISTRAVRLKITQAFAEAALPSNMSGKSSNGKRVWCGELLALQDLGSNALSTVVLNPTTTNAAIPITFTLASAGYVTLVIDDGTGKRVRNLVAETYFPAGTNTVYWDGLDESEMVDQSWWRYKTAGKLVPTGTYTARGLVRDALTLTYEFSVNTGGNPAWFTRDNVGGWLGEHSAPMAIAFIPSNKHLVLGSPVAEAGNGFMETDLTPQSVYGARSLGAGGSWWGADTAAVDTGSSPESGVLAYFIASGGGTVDAGNLLGGSRSVQFWAYGGVGSAENYQRYSYTYPTNLSFVAGRPAFGGLAVRNQLAVISLNQTDQLALIRASDGHEYNKVTVSNPRGVAFDSAGKLYVLSGTSLVRYDVPTAQDGMTLSNATTLVTGLTDPRALTIDTVDTTPTNDLYISDWGTSQQVKVYTSTGTFVRAIGTAGAIAGLGAYDATHMNYPSGLTISKDNSSNKRLWVTENCWAPKRISRWTLTGTLDKAIYGPGPFENGGMIDPQNKNRFYASHWYGSNAMEFALDWTNGTATLASLYGPLADGIIPSGMGSQAIYVNGQQYLTNGEGSPGSPHVGNNVAGIWHMRSGIATPVAAVGSAHSWPAIKDAAFDSVWTTAGLDKSNTSQKVFCAWTDTDNDQVVDPNELTLKAVSAEPYTVFIGADLAATTSGGLHLAPTGYTANYAPIFNANNAVQDYTHTLPGVWPDGGMDSLAGANGWRVLVDYPIHGWQNGTLKWTYPNEWGGSEEGNLPPVAPGYLLATKRVLGLPINPSAQSGEVFGIGSSRGMLYLMTTDGLFVGTLFKKHEDTAFWPSGSSNSWASLTASRGMDVTDVGGAFPNFFPTMTQTADGNVYVVAGSEHSSIARVNGLNTITRLGPMSVTVNLTNQTAAADYQVTHEKERQQQGMGRETMNIVHLANAPTIDGQRGDWPYTLSYNTIYEWLTEVPSETGRFTGALGLNGSTLYGVLTASNGSYLANDGTDWQRLFRTGGAIVLSLGTNAAADPYRTAPVQGDVQLVFTKIDGTVKATLYRQVQSGGSSVNFTNAAGRSVTMQDVTDVSAQVTFSGNGGTMEFAVPTSVLGWSPAAGSAYLGDLGLIQGRGTPKTAFQSTRWNNKAPGVIGDEPYEVQCYPQVWGRFVVGSNSAPSATLTYPTNNSQHLGGTSVVCKAAAFDPDGTVSKVEFYALPAATGVWTKLGEDTTAPYTYTWSVARGCYTVAACAVDNLGARSAMSTALVTLGDTGTGLLGNYYDTTTFTTVKTTRADAQVNFDFGSAGPTSAYTDPNTYSIRWTGTVKPRYSEPYTCWTLAEDGSKLTVNSVVLWNRWTDSSGPVWNSGTTASLTAGTAYSVTLDQYKNTGNGSMKLYWSSASQPFELVPMMQLTPTSSGVTPTGVTLTTTPAGGSTVVVPGQTVTMTSTASCTDGVREVQFFAGKELVGTDTTSPYSVVWTPNAYGSYSLTSKAVSVKGKTTTSSAVTLTVKEKPVVSLTAPTTGGLFGPAPASITLTAVAYDDDGTVSKVDFYANGTTLIGTDSTAPYSYTWTNVAQGSYALTAVATDNETYTQTSAGVNITVLDVVGEGMTLWLKADAGVTADGNGKVSAWADQSGNGRNAVQATGSLQPTLVTGLTELNGQSTIRFDGVDDWVSFGTISDIRTVFWVLKDTRTGDAGGPLLGDGSTYHFFRGNYYSNCGPNKAIWHSDYTHKDLLNFWEDSLITTRKSYAASDGIFKSGEFTDGRYFGVPNEMCVISTRTRGPVQASNFVNDRGYGYTWAGDLSELITYNRPLSDTELAQVESYLITRYHLNNAAPSVTVTSPTSSATLTPGADITINVNATDDVSVSKVEFYWNDTKVGEDTSSPYSYTKSAVGRGSYTITAKAIDNQGKVGTSSAVEVGVSSIDQISLAGLKLWLKADTIAGKSDGQAVATWPDWSGRNTPATQPTASLQPQYKVNIANSRPALRFDGADDYVSFTNKISDIRTVFWVVSDDQVGQGDAGGGAPHRLLLAGDNMDFNRGSWYNSWTGTPNRSIWNGDWTSPYVVAFWQYPEITTRLNGGNVDGRFYGIPNTLATISTRTAGNVSAMNFSYDRGIAGNVWDGDLAELIIYNRPLDTTEIANVEAYLNSKYGLNGANPAPAVTLGGVTDGQNVSEGATLNLTATATDNGSVSKVEFYGNATKLGEDSTSPYTCTWSNVAGGSYSVIARAIDNQSAIGESTPAGITVGTITGTVRQINSGGAATGTWAADADYLGGTANAPGGTIDVSGLTDPAPQAVYGANRYGDFSYMLSGLIPNDNYTVRLHYCENYWSSAGQRVFNVKINGTQVQTNYDIVADAGSNNKGRIKEFAATPDADGKIVIEFVSVTNLAQINGIELRGPVTAAPTVNITSPTNGASYSAPASVTMTATASDSDGSVSRVDFYQGTTLLGSDSTSPYSYTWTNVSACTYALTARAIDEAGALGTSTPVAITATGSTTTAFAAYLDTDTTTQGSWWTLLNGYVYGKNGYVLCNWNGTTVTDLKSGAGGVVQSVTHGLSTHTWSGAPTNDVRATINPATGTRSAACWYTSGQGDVTITLNNATDGILHTMSVYCLDWDSTTRSTTLDVLDAATNSSLLAAPVAVNSYNGGKWVKFAFRNNVKLRVNTVSGNSTIAAICFDDDPSLANNALPTVSVTAPANNTTYLTGDTVALTATATDSDGTISKVEFYQGTTKLGEDTTSPFGYDWTNVAVGNYSLTAKATDNLSGVTTSSAITITVGTGVVFADDFADNSIGSAWTTYQGTWSESGGLLQQTGGNGDRRAIVTGITVPSPVVITAKVRVDSWIDGSDYRRAGVALCTNSSTGQGYNLLFHNDHNTVQFLDDGAAWGPSYSFAWSTGTWYWFKMKHDGSTLYGKIWEDGTSEPSSWPYSWTRSGRTGYPALNGGCDGNNNTVSFDDVAVTDVDASIVAPPTFSPAGGTYTSAQSVTISCATSGATIRYTTDGSEPTANSTAYSSALNISSTTTLKAKAFKASMVSSATTTAAYTILLFADNFNDNSLSASWTTYQGTWSESGGLLQQTGGNGDRRAIVTGITPPTTVTITAKVRVDSWIDGSDYRRAGVALCTNSSTGQGYNLLFHNDHNTVQFLDDGAGWSSTYTFAWSTGTWYWFKMKHDGSTLYGKIWEDGTSEPSSWPYSWTRSGRTGYPALNGGCDGNNNTVSFDDVTIE